MQTLECLRIHNILSVPVFGKKGGWIGSGGVEVIVGEKQYIGIASVVDILSYMFGNPSRTVEEALSKPISQVLGSTDESVRYALPMCCSMMYAVSIAVPVG